MCSESEQKFFLQKSMPLFRSSLKSQHEIRETLVRTLGSSGFSGVASGLPSESSTRVGGPGSDSYVAGSGRPSPHVTQNPGWMLHHARARAEWEQSAGDYPAAPYHGGGDYGAPQQEQLLPPYAAPLLVAPRTGEGAAYGGEDVYPPRESDRFLPLPARLPVVPGEQLSTERTRDHYPERKSKKNRAFGDQMEHHAALSSRRRSPAGPTDGETLHLLSPAVSSGSGVGSGGGRSENAGAPSAGSGRGGAKIVVPPRPSPGASVYSLGEPSVEESAVVEHHHPYWEHHYPGGRREEFSFPPSAPRAAQPPPPQPTVSAAVVPAEDRAREPPRKNLFGRTRRTGLIRASPPQQPIRPPARSIGDMSWRSEAERPAEHQRQTGGSSASSGGSWELVAGAHKTTFAHGATFAHSSAPATTRTTQQQPKQRQQPPIFPVDEYLTTTPSPCSPVSATQEVLNDTASFRELGYGSLNSAQLGLSDDASGLFSEAARSEDLDALLVGGGGGQIPFAGGMRGPGGAGGGGTSSGRIASALLHEEQPHFVQQGRFRPAARGTAALHEEQRVQPNDRSGSSAHYPRRVNRTNPPEDLDALMVGGGGGQIPLGSLGMRGPAGAGRIAPAHGQPPNTRYGRSGSYPAAPRRVGSTPEDDRRAPSPHHELRFTPQHSTMQNIRREINDLQRSFERVRGAAPPRSPQEGLVRSSSSYARPQWIISGGPRPGAQQEQTGFFGGSSPLQPMAPLSLQPHPPNAIMPAVVPEASPPAYLIPGRVQNVRSGNSPSRSVLSYASSQNSFGGPSHLSQQSFMSHLDGTHKQQNGVKTSDSPPATHHRHPSPAASRTFLPPATDVCGKNFFI